MKLEYMNIEIYILDILYTLFASITGFIIAYYINFKKTKGKHRLQELVLLMKKNCYHIHHYITFGIIIISMLLGKYIPFKLLVIIIAFFIGISLEDLMFKDWNIIKNNCHKSKLIKAIKNIKDINPKYN